MIECRNLCIKQKVKYLDIDTLIGILSFLLFYTSHVYTYIIASAKKYKGPDEFVPPS